MAIVERYVNRVYEYSNENNKCARWWVNDHIMVGGSICDIADWQHLQDTYKIKSVVNVETEHTDTDKKIEHLMECQVPDNGAPFPKEYVKYIVQFSKHVIEVGLSPIYVHCQGGGSRSPAFAYAILRWCFNKSPDEALQIVRTAKDDMLLQYGEHDYHKSYLGSVEAALAELRSLNT